MNRDMPPRPELSLEDVFKRLRDPQASEAHDTRSSLAELQSPTRSEASESVGPTLEIGEAVAAVSNTTSDFIENAAQKGMNREETKRAMIHAWNQGGLPRVIPGETYRDGSSHVYILHGEVPNDFFAAFADGPGEGVVMPSQHTRGYATMQIVPLASLPKKPSDRNPEAFYVESVLFPGPGHQTSPELDKDNLRKLKEALRPGVKAEVSERIGRSSLRRAIRWPKAR